MSKPGFETLAMVKSVEGKKGVQAGVRALDLVWICAQSSWCTAAQTGPHVR